MDTGVVNESLGQGEFRKDNRFDRSLHRDPQPIVRDRLGKAGVRLGGLLNQALDN
jgi:hypothetical protein